MSEKLKLPTISKAAGPQVSEALQVEMLKTRRAEIDTGARVEVAELDVAKEALVAFRAFFDLIRSYNELAATRVEWQARVAQAELALDHAKVELDSERERNLPRMESLRQAREVQTRLLALFDDMLRELQRADLSEERRFETRKQLLDLSDKLVQLRK